MHKRNLHNTPYDIDKLVKTAPELSQYVVKTNGRSSIDFGDANAVKQLNAALLTLHYNVSFWDIPPQYLCPPIPGRADYIHNLADLLAQDSFYQQDHKRDEHGIPIGKSIKGLDIGTGANVIYPILGQRIYDWSFTGSDIDKGAVASASAICKANAGLNKYVKIVHQKRQSHIFSDVVLPTSRFDFCMCNPPFHKSAKEAASGALRKQTNLARHKQKRGSALPLKVGLNFAGQSAELWCEGGELRFINMIIKESVEYQTNIRWFTSLVSKKENLAKLIASIERIKPAEIKTVSMSQGQKESRFLAWRF